MPPVGDHQCGFLPKHGIRGHDIPKKKRTNGIGPRHSHQAARNPWFHAKMVTMGLAGCGRHMNMIPVSMNAIGGMTICEQEDEDEEHKSDSHVSVVTVLQSGLHYRSTVMHRMQPYFPKMLRRVATPPKQERTDQNASRRWTNLPSKWVLWTRRQPARVDV